MTGTFKTFAAAIGRRFDISAETKVKIMLPNVFSNYSVGEQMYSTFNIIYLSWHPHGF